MISFLVWIWRASWAVNASKSTPSRYGYFAESMSNSKTYPSKCGPAPVASITDAALFGNWGIWNISVAFCRRFSISLSRYDGRKTVAAKTLESSFECICSWRADSARQHCHFIATKTAIYRRACTQDQARKHNERKALRENALLLRSWIVFPISRSLPNAKRNLPKKVFRQEKLHFAPERNSTKAA